MSEQFQAPPHPIVWVVYKDSKPVHVATAKVAFDAREQAAILRNSDAQGLRVRAYKDLSAVEANDPALVKLMALGWKRA